ncbi:MAG: PAS domain-containing protein [Syntrophobacteraceae bacterium]
MDVQNKTRDELVREVRRLREELSKAHGRGGTEGPPRNSGERFRALFENLAEEVHSWRLVRDEAGGIRTWRLVDVNPPAIHAWGGTSVDEFREKTADEIYGPEASERFLSTVEKAVTQGTSACFENSFPHLDKTLRFTIIPLEDGFIAVGADVTGLLKSENALRESRFLLHAVTDGIPDPIFVKDGKGRLIMANAATLALIGKPACEVIGRTDEEFYQDSNMGRAIMENDREVMESGQGGVFEEIAPSPEGTRVFLSTKIPWRDAEGRVIGLLGIARDITERKKAGEEIRELSQRLSYHVDNSPLAVIEWGPDMRLIRWSGEAERIFGWSAGEVIGKRIEDLRWVYDEDREHVTEVSTELKTGANPQRFSCNRNYRKDGSVIHCEWYNSSLVDDSGRLRSILSLVLDVTERTRAEEELRRRENEAREQAMRFHAILNAVPAIIWMAYDRECQTISGNKAALRFSRVPGKTNMSKTGPEPGRLAHYRLFSEGRELVSEEMPIQRVAASGEALYDYPVEFLFDDGAQHFLLGNVVPFLNEREEPEGAVAAFLDITERKRMEEELRKSRDELEQRVRERTAELKATNRALTEYTVRLERLNEELREFAFIASHDLQEPLRKIQTFGHLLSEKFRESLGGESADFVMRMTRAAARMSDLLQSLRHYSRIATRPSPFGPVNLSEAAREALVDLELVLEETGAEVEIGELPTIDGDAMQVRELFQNLFSNSVRYCRKSEKPVIRVQGSESGGMCKVFVEDNGMGFADCFVDRIFKPFQQLHPRSAGYGGTGMGLAICRKIVERHGGSITATSTPGKGTTFIISLPVRQGKREP